MDLSRLSAPELLERLAELEHDRWAHWQSYLHGVCVKNLDGSLTIPAKLVARWDRQIGTEYAELSEREKESDREQVLLYLPVIRDYVTSAGTDPNDQ